MLARSFLTAKQLGLTDEQHNALLMVLRAMERGEFKHTTMEDNLHQITGNDDPRLFMGRFNMGFWSEGIDCGTVCCIGGAAEAMAKKPIFGGGWNSLRCDNPEVMKLFYPAHENERFDDHYDEITVDQAQQALTNYLTFGKPDWSSIIKLGDE